MPLQSMTGFARAQGNADCGGASGKWIWELRSVNSKGIDVRLRTPPGMDALENEARKRITAAFTRGSVQASLQFEGSQTGSVPVVNEAALEAVLSAVEKLRQRIGAAVPAAETILAMRGVMEAGEVQAEEAELAARQQALLAGLDEAIDALRGSRQSEGAAVEKVLTAHVAEIARLAALVEADPSRRAEAIRERLLAQIAPLLDNASSLDPQRLHQEAALIAVKSDLREELDRLQAHIAAAGKLLADDKPAGRRLDFLAQEFNRECNTICSKSNAASVTAAGLEMKVVIDQFREQVQNIE